MSQITYVRIEEVGVFSKRWREKSGWKRWLSYSHEFGENPESSGQPHCGVKLSECARAYFYGEPDRPINLVGDTRGYGDLAMPCRACSTNTIHTSEAHALSNATFTISRNIGRTWKPYTISSWQSYCSATPTPMRLKYRDRIFLG